MIDNSEKVCISKELRETNPSEKVFTTIRNIKNGLLTDDFINQIKNVYKHSLRGFRVNLKNFENQENYKIIINDLLPLNDGNCDVMLDLPYPNSKVRGRLKDSISMKLPKEQVVYITYDNSISFENTIYVTREGFDKIKRVSDVLFFGDGKGALKIEKVYGEYLKLRSLKEQIFYTTHSFITECISNEDDVEDFFNTLNSARKFPGMIALSFVKTKNDIVRFREKINFDAKIVAKIETKEAVKNIHEIIDEADAIMLARGDLAYAIDLSDFYKTQEKVINLCHKKGKELIVATDILSSLENRAFPSRADIIDLQHIWGRVDAITLSGGVSYNELDNAIKTINKLIK